MAGKTYKIGNKNFTKAELDELGIDEKGNKTPEGRRQQNDRMDKRFIEDARNDDDRSATDDFDKDGNLTEYAKARNRSEQYDEKQNKKKKPLAKKASTFIPDEESPY